MDKEVLIRFKMPNIKATEDVSEILKSILKGDYTALKVIEIREIEINKEIFRN